MNDLIIKSIDKIISGDINKGIIPGDTIIVRDGKIAQIGFENEVDKSGIETVHRPPRSQYARRLCSAARRCRLLC